ncbi:DUF488 family protein [Dyella amyloliquefaciens]|uniref:DUF488 domain-containing protein n=1 Tax=Dyella amyloliquefaciens TaxID=1770545 RepID=UPI00102E85AC|nr:DUF488 domain-containing protein [Dyella amyloliquefaciens]
MSAFFTIGHSNRSVEELVELLVDAGVRRVVDVRAFPRSYTHPQFNEDVLPLSLAPSDISYEHLSPLGGRRGKSKTVPSGVNGFWSNPSFHHYADYALSDAFRAGLDDLIARGHASCCAIMCSEAVWWRCHRRIITDYLITRGETVCHILGRRHVDEARLTVGAVPQADGNIFYPAAAPMA